MEDFFDIEFGSFSFAFPCKRSLTLDENKVPLPTPLMPLSHQRVFSAGSELEPEKYRFFLFTPQRRVLAPESGSLPAPKNCRSRSKTPELRGGIAYVEAAGN